MDTEYYSCRFIEGGLVFVPEELLVCCITNHGRGYPKICDFHGGRLPEAKIIAVREEVRALNQNPARHPLCAGCGYLEKRGWERPEYPFHHLTIAHFTECNLSCRYCYVTRDGLRENPPEPFDIIPILETMIREKKLSPQAQVSWGGGEPALFKDFEKIFGMLLEYGVFQQLATNATVLSPVIREALLRRRASLTCSVDAGTAQTYRKIKGRDFFDRVFENMGSYARTGGEVAAKFIVLKENCDEIVPFLDRVEQAGIRGVVYEINFHDDRQSDEVVEAIAQLIYECSIQRDIGVYEGEGGVAPLGDEFRARINAALQRQVTWEAFLQKHKRIKELEASCEHLEGSTRRLEQSLRELQERKVVRLIHALEQHPRLNRAVGMGLSFWKKARGLFT